MKKIKILLMIAFCFCVNLAKADEWRLKAGRAKDIAVGANGAVWSIGDTPADGSFNIQSWNGSTWQNVDGGAVRIAVDPSGNPWVINSANQIFRRQGNAWVLLPGLATDIGIGANGAVWIIGTAAVAGGKSIHFWNGTNWTIVPGGGSRISVAPNGQPFIVNADGIIQERLSSGVWNNYPGRATDISIGANGSIWVVGNIARGGGSFSIHKWNGSDWEEVDGGGSQIAVDNQGRPWVTNHLNEIYKRTFTAPNYLASPLIVQNSIRYIMSGCISTLAVNPVNHNHVIVAGETGGLFETTTAASRGPWTHLTQFKNNAVTDVLIVPGGAIGNEIWVTTNISYDNSTAPQIWKRNYAGSWSRAAISPATSTTFINSGAYRIIRSKNSDRLYAFGDFGFAYKEPTSDIWIIARRPGGTIISIEAMKDGTVLAATTTGIYYLTDVTNTWQSATSASPLNLLNSQKDQRYALKSDESGTIALVCKVNTTGGTQIFGTTDYGRTWTVFSGICGIRSGASGGFQSVYPIYNTSTSALTIYVSNSENLFYTSAAGSITDALRTIQNNASLVWAPAADRGGFGFNGNHTDTRQIAFLTRFVTSPKMLITNDGGIDLAEVTGNQPENFTWPLQVNTGGLNALQMYNITGTNKEFYFGTQDNSYGYNNNGNLTSWAIGGGAEGFLIEKRGDGFFDDITLVGLGAPWVKFKNGWEDATECPAGSNSNIWNSPTSNYGVPANYCKAVYIQDAIPLAGTGSDWKITFNKGCTWSSIGRTEFQKCDGIRYCFSKPLNASASLHSCFIREGKIVLGRLDDALLPSNTRNWIIASMADMDGGIAKVNNGFLNTPLFTINPENPLLAFAVEKNTGLLKKSTNGGNSWDEVTSFTSLYSDGGNASLKGNNGQYSIWNVEYSPYDPNFILVGTVSKGIFFSKNGGNSWQKITDNVGVYMPTDFHWRSAKEILVATYGRGLFRIVL